jgi:hypothetical protein
MSRGLMMVLPTKKKSHFFSQDLRPHGRVPHTSRTLRCVGLAHRYRGINQPGDVGTLPPKPPAGRGSGIEVRGPRSEVCP